MRFFGSLCESGNSPSAGDIRRNPSRLIAGEQLGC